MRRFDQGFCPLTLPGHAAGAIPRSEASGTRSPHRKGGERAVRQRRDCQRQGGRGIGLMIWPTHVNRRELIVNQNKPKALTGLNQKVRDREQERRDDCRRPYGRR